MRQSCELSAILEAGEERWVCGEPAVDFVMRQKPDGSERKMWLCARHFDYLQKLRELLRELP